MAVHRARNLSEDRCPKYERENLRLRQSTGSNQ
jgi:hypothetical protein